MPEAARRGRSLGLGALDPAVAECLPHVDDAGIPVDIAVLERDPLPGTQTGRCREDHEGALAVVELGGDLSELRPGLERRFSVRRRCGFSTPCLAGLTSIMLHSTARLSTCRSAGSSFATLNRLRLRVVLVEVLINKPRERKRRSGAVRPPHALQRPLKRLARVPLGDKPAALHPARAAPTSPILVESRERVRRSTFGSVPLESVGYVKRRKGVHRGRRTTWISLTPDGRQALGVHVAALRALIDGVE